jgi:hypothetical protein
MYNKNLIKKYIIKIFRILIQKKNGIISDQIPSDSVGY